MPIVSGQTRAQRNGFSPNPMAPRSGAPVTGTMPGAGTDPNGGLAGPTTPGGVSTSGNAGNGPNRPVDPVRVNVGQPTLDSFRQYGDATMAEYRRNLDPMFQSQEARFRQDMVNRGLQEGTEAYDRAFANFDRSRNDANNSAATAALQASLGAQQQAFGQNLSESQLANALLQSREGNQTQMSISDNSLAAQQGMQQSAQEIQRQNFLDQLRFNREEANRAGSQWDRQFGEGQSQWDDQFGLQRDQFGLQSGQADFGNLMQLMGIDMGANQYNNSLNDADFQRASALFGMTPQGGPAQIDAVSPYQMQQNQQNANYQAGMAQNNGMWSALGGLGSAFLLCDENAKTQTRTVDPDECLRVLREVPLAEFTYREDNHERRFIGTFAQPWARSLTGEESTIIRIMDAFGVILGSLKAIDARMQRLEAHAWPAG